MSQVREKVDQDLKRIGVGVVDVRLKRVDLPQEVSESVYRRMEAERKRIANELRSTGAAEGEKIRADADRQREVILAEAYHGTGNDPLALQHLNNARAYANTAFPHSAPLLDLPALVGISGAALLDSIMTEKWVAMFQNIAVIDDYRRTCLPAITPYLANTQGFHNVPGRLFYPLNERNVNSNVPDPSVQLSTHGFRNAGDVFGCQDSAHY
jgi:hypothetical protein